MFVYVYKRGFRNMSGNPRYFNPYPANVENMASP